MSMISVCWRSAVLMLASSLASAAPPPDADQFLEDFDRFWQEVTDQYAYFDQKQTDWSAVKALYRPEVAQVKTTREFIQMLERALDELYDPHAHLNSNTPQSPPLLPSGTDLWAQWHAGQARVVQVRPDTPAALAGIKAGFVVTAVDGEPVQAAMQKRLGRSLRTVDDAARSWALTAVLAGRRDQPRVIAGMLDGKALTLQVAAASRYRLGADDKSMLDHRRIAGFGYIRINNTLGRQDLIAAFDQALAALQHTEGLLLDLRDTPSGGNTVVGRAILSRFIQREQPYQKHSIPWEEAENGVRRSWLELVSPRGPFAYSAPVVVLVDHWTGSMGEGIAIGMDALGRGTVVGTAMAQLLGATYQITLPHTGIGFNLPAEKLFHVNGLPRESYRPTVMVDLSLPSTEADPILAAGLAQLRLQGKRG